MTDAQPDLYDADYYAWIQDQARRLRDLAGDNRIDALNLAEEIEDLGKSELAEVESLFEPILEHFVKIEYSGLQDPIRHWSKEITAFRRRLRKRLTASLRRVVIDDLEECYWQACREASKSLKDDSLEDRVPNDCPYTVEQVLDPDWFPEPKRPDA